MINKPNTAVVVEDDGEWDAFVATSPNGEIYHTSRWLSLLENVFGVQAIRLGVRVGNSLVGGIPVLVRQLGPLRLAGSPLQYMATPQMGPLSACPDEEGVLLDAFDAFQRSERIAFAEVTYPMSMQKESLVGRGYRVRTPETLHLQLNRDVGHLWQGLVGSCRSAIRKAQREGVVVEAATSADFVQDYQRMARAVFARQGRRPPHDELYYRAVWDGLAASGKAHVLLARHRGRLVAGAVFLIHGRRLYYQDGASYPEHQHLRANNLIQWEAIRWAVGQRLELYDMVGAGSPSIARFKRSFGASPVEKLRAVRTNTPTAAAAFACYHVYSRLRFFGAFRRNLSEPPR